MSSRQAPFSPMPSSADEILEFLLSLERLDLALTAEQACASAAYARDHARRFALILNAFAPLIPRGSRIFSIGSMPNHLELLFARYLDATVIGSTYSPLDARDKFTAVYRSGDGTKLEIEIYVRDFTRDPFPVAADSCDAVLCSEVVEHLLESPLLMLREAYRVLRADGHLLLTTPNMQHWHRILYMVNGRTYPDVDFREPIESRHTHLFSLRELRELLTAARFGIDRHFFADPWDHVANHPTMEMADPVNRAVREALGEAEEFQHECVFLVARPLPSALVLERGWHAVEYGEDGWRCWTSGRGALRMTTARAARATVSAEVYSIEQPNRVEVSVNGTRQSTLAIDWNLYRPIAFEVQLDAGENVIELVSQRAGITLPTDSRQLAVCVKNLTVRTDDRRTYALTP